MPFAITQNNSTAFAVDTTGMIREGGGGNVYYEDATTGEFKEIMTGVPEGSPFGGGREKIVDPNFANDLNDYTTYGTTSATGGIATIGATANSGISQSVLTTGESFNVKIVCTAINGVGIVEIADDSGKTIERITAVGTKEFSFTHTDTNPNLILRGLNNALFSVSEFSVKTTRSQTFHYTRLVIFDQQTTF